MAVDTKNVTNRRKIHFKSYNEMIAEANSLESTGYQSLGNWSLAQVLEHLAKTHTASLDGGLPEAPLRFKIFAHLFLKKTFINKGLPAGTSPPENVVKRLMPSEGAMISEAMNQFAQSCERLKSESGRVKHPFLGKLTNKDWDKLHCRHAELHFSFLLPLSEAESS